MDNEGLACLDDVALNLQRDVDATLVIVGEDARQDAVGRRVAAQRAVNVKDYLVKEKGIEASRLKVWSDAESAKKVKMMLIPAGAVMAPETTSTGAQPVNETTMKAIPRRMRR